MKCKHTNIVVPQTELSLFSCHDQNHASHRDSPALLVYSTLNPISIGIFFTHTSIAAQPRRVTLPHGDAMDTSMVKAKPKG